MTDNTKTPPSNRNDADMNADEWDMPRLNKIDLMEENIRLHKELAEAKRLISEHNSLCISSCEARTNCEGWTSRGRTCPDCPKDWLIEKEGK
jgi:hypothetical protein